MADPTPLGTERELLAGELALGLLDGLELLEAERLRQEDPAFAAEVDRWERHAQGWLDDIPTQKAPENGWARFEAGRTGGVSSRPASRPSTFWRPTAIAASLAAVLFAGLWALERGTPEVPIDAAVEERTEPQLAANTLSVAQIARNEADWLLSAVYDQATGQLYLRLAAIEEGAKVPELWVINPEGTPRSLGFLTDQSAATLVLTPEMRRDMVEGSAIAVSLEEPSDRPHDAPQGTILGVAALAPLADGSATGAS